MSQEQPRRPLEANEQGEFSAPKKSVVKSEKHGKGTISKTTQGKVEGKGGESAPVAVKAAMKGRGNESGVTIGEALEATALTAGNKPVDYSDAAAIQAAEVRATGRTNIIPGGVAAAAQSAATRNARLAEDEEKTKLAEILKEASSKLPSDKAVTRKDAEGVIGAELRNDPNLCTRPGGVAASLAAAARLNQTNSPSASQNTSPK
ncbi:hypothetical protein LIER_15720 [Lithospermum erythrorhizon]|uniref:SMP domain-containing protein n=1 Tax=Lithospermum erythrorhizon TaxID=34254 RepID=A0AAV3Q812_LITER